ncbi:MULTISPECIES: hypothetical protein [Yersinia]|uniref:Uncharacterized protein n=1 Tax=Yersinia pekkanenii TaxID=1288385 RepID=A0A0T9Q807_9GAMM|nr:MULTISPECIES: hypothetical protein [Yersinia]CNI00211.1 Uncharacterised protein [Yersinia pekkanenii]CRY68395.1 Uncharacterised protein [Yersinia pekkanenii]
MARNPKDEFTGMRELTSFDTAHSAFGEFIIMRSSFTDTLTGFRQIEPEHYPDQQVMIRLDAAKKLIRELQKRVDYIESGIEDVNTKTRYHS